MPRTSIRSLLVLSVGWMLLSCLALLLFRPSIHGGMAVSLAPNPFWTVVNQGLGRFDVILHPYAWIAFSLGPLAAVWLLAVLLNRPRHGAAR